MRDNESQLIFEFHKGQSQFAYFLLGVAASAVAFAVHETAETPLAEAPWPFGLAILFWALSFAVGCYGLEARQTSIHSNALFLQVFRGNLNQPEGSYGANVIKQAKQAVEDDLRKPLNLFRWQKWALFFGALSYVSGHVMHMAALPPSHGETMRAATHAKSIESGPAAQGKPKQR